VNGHAELYRRGFAIVSLNQELKNSRLVGSQGKSIDSDG